jgi:hypothetical protein
VFVTGICALLAGTMISALIMILFAIFSSFTTILSFLSLAWQLEYDYDEFWEGLDNWLEQEGLQRKDITGCEYNEDGSVTIYIGDRKIVLKKTEDGWIVVEDSAKSEDDGDDTNDGDNTNNGDGNKEDDDNSSSNSPPGNPNHPPYYY